MAINKDTTTKKVVYLPNDLWERVDNYRFDQRLKSEGEAIRRLIEIGLRNQKAAAVTFALMELLHAPIKDGRMTPEEIRRADEIGRQALELQVDIGNALYPDQHMDFDAFLKALKERSDKKR